MIKVLNWFLNRCTLNENSDNSRYIKDKYDNCLEILGPCTENDEKYVLGRRSIVDNEIYPSIVFRGFKDPQSVISLIISMMKGTNEDVYFKIVSADDENTESHEVWTVIGKEYFVNKIMQLKLDASRSEVIAKINEIIDTLNNNIEFGNIKF